MRELDLAKPIWCEKHGNVVSIKYDGSDSMPFNVTFENGRSLWMYKDGTYGDVTLLNGKRPSKPKLEGFLEVYSDDREFDGAETIAEDSADEELDTYDGEKYWLTIDMSKVPPEAIVKVAD